MNLLLIPIQALSRPVYPHTIGKLLCEELSKERVTARNFGDPAECQEKVSVHVTVSEGMGLLWSFSIITVQIPPELRQS